MPIVASAILVLAQPSPAEPSRAQPANIRLSPADSEDQCLASLSLAPALRVAGLAWCFVVTMEDSGAGRGGPEIVCIHEPQEWVQSPKTVHGSVSSERESTYHEAAMSFL